MDNINNNNRNNVHVGRIEVITGSMFSGKTEELLRRVKRAEIARLSIERFKPSLDTRNSEEEIVSHDNHAMPCTMVESSGEILLYADGADVVAIDEAQFFDNGITEVCQKLAANGVRVIIAGLHMDYKCRPFGPMPALCSVADEVVKLHAVCVRCGASAYMSHRKVKSDARVLLGESDEYEPLCRECYNEVVNDENYGK